jgi:hypothetical protein
MTRAVKGILISSMDDENNFASLVPFADARSEVHKFETALKSYGIDIESGSDLELIAIVLSELEDMRAGRTKVDSNEDPRPTFRKAVGLLEFIVILNRQHDAGGLHSFVDHLQLLNQARSVAPGVRTLRDEAANKLFELFWAMVCLSVGTDLKLDPPKGAKGDNPDILDRRWGFACKAVEGQNPLSWYELIKKGLDQIDRSAEAETGCVVINPSVLVNHDAMWPLLNADYQRQEEPPALGCWIHEDMVVSLLYQTADNINARLIRKNEQDNVTALFRNIKRKSLPLTLSMMQTVCQINVLEKAPVSTVAFLSVSSIDPISEADQHVLKRLNDALQSRLQHV